MTTDGDSKQLFLTSEGGNLIVLDTQTGQYEVLYRCNGTDYLFGIACDEDRLYFSGCTFLGCGRIGAQGFEITKIATPFESGRGTPNRIMRSLWTYLGAHSKVIPYGKPDLHKINRYGSFLYVAATSWNEIWVVDSDLRLNRRIKLQPEIRDYYHLNNVFCDGAHFYVCLNRYAGCPGQGGYAKFDLRWNEIERRAVGWESHALSVIDGHVVQLCCLSWRSEGLPNHARKAGLMVHNDLVFEYDYTRYFCKDFSMDDDRIYIVGGTNTQRAGRATADGVVFVLNRGFQLLDVFEVNGLGGLNGCRLRGTDYSAGVPPLERHPDISMYQQAGF